MYQVRWTAKGLCATDDERIYNEVINKGGLAVMTDSMALNGTFAVLMPMRRSRKLTGN